LKPRPAAFIFLACLAWAVPAHGQSPPGAWQEFERQVRDAGISREQGARQIVFWAAELPARFPADGFSGRVAFPLAGYDLRQVGGRNGEGFRPAGYEFLDGNRHKGHPAQDIFVYDRNQDGRDDRTGRPVQVLSVADGIVLSTDSQWRPEGESRRRRGGNYIWIYHPALGLFSYYAHLGEIAVGPDQRVRAGDPIATLGRSGTNAYPGRSPTHLHLMLLRASDMAAVDPYPLLKAAGRYR
jgi:murein DD-endopeptidase MepM/ murein hydrolase activator NlpD